MNAPTRPVMVECVSANQYYSTARTGFKFTEDEAILFDECFKNGWTNEAVAAYLERSHTSISVRKSQIKRGIYRGKASAHYRYHYTGSIKGQPQIDYLKAEALKRQMDPEHLIRHIISTILEDKMIGAVIDDGK